MADASQATCLDHYFEQTASLTNSLLLVAPLLFLYQIGLVHTQLEGLNGVDFFTVLLLQHGGARGALLFHCVLFLGIVLGWAIMKKQQQFSPSYVLPLMLECMAYALCFSAAIQAVMVNLPLSQGVGLAGQQDGLVRCVIALGAGIHEELIFRLLLLGGLLLLLESLFAWPRWAAVIAAIAVSSLLFALAHHVGPGAELFEREVFLYRCLAGVFLALLYQYRSFAVAVYTHVLYDLMVLFS